MKGAKKEIISNKFKWIPMEKRVDNLGLSLPPRKPETGKPLLWVAIDPQDNFIKDIYLVNDTGKTIEAVVAQTGGFETVDDDVITVSRSDIEYKNIENGDAVKIEEYHEIYDSDYVLYIYIKVKISGNWINLETSAKGGFKEEVLLWS